MAELFKVTRQTTDTENAKGQSQTQEYLGQTVKVTSTTPNPIVSSRSNISAEEVISSATKGTGQTTESYSGPTIAEVATLQQVSTELGTRISAETVENSSTKGNVRETRTNTGVGKTMLRTEDKGVNLEFVIKLQNRTPAPRSAC